MQKRLIKNLENAKGYGWGSNSDRKDQRKRFRTLLSREMIQEGIKEYYEMDRNFIVRANR